VISGRSLGVLALANLPLATAGGRAHVAPMKRIKLLGRAAAFVCILGLGGALLVPEACAKEKKVKTSTKTQRAQLAGAPCCAQKPGDTTFENVTITTGTHLKEKTKKRGEITTGRNNVIVLDREAMRRSGAATVRDVLGGQATTW
jgi:hypothetical protein